MNLFLAGEGLLWQIPYLRQVDDTKKVLVFKGVCLEGVCNVFNK